MVETPINMAASNEDILRQLLAQFLVAALEHKSEEQRLGKKVAAATFYDAQLQRALLSTPLDVVQKEDQLQSLLGDKLSPREIDCVIEAAYL